MPTYVYESVPAKKGVRVRRYEIRQSIKDSPLTRHPETGEAIKRVITAGAGVLTSSPASSQPSRHTHTPSCGCGPGGCGR